MPVKLVAKARLPGPELIRGTPSSQATFSWQLRVARADAAGAILRIKLPAPLERPGRQQRSTRTLTGKDELLTIGIMLLLTMLVIGAALTPALTRPRPVPLVARTRDRRR